jgi:hypothetical protein
MMVSSRSDRAASAIEPKKISVQHRITVTARQIVKCGHLAAQLDKPLDHVRADVTCSANNKYFHHDLLRKVQRFTIVIFNELVPHSLCNGLL